MKGHLLKKVCFLLLLLFCLPGCGAARGGKLTLAAIRSMAAEKGASLTWSDFAQYTSAETGSGLYILVYETDGAYRLMIGGIPGEAPMYIYLVSTEDNDRRIDIRYNDVDGFLNRQNEAPRQHGCKRSLPALHKLRYPRLFRFRPRYGIIKATALRPQGGTYVSILVMGYRRDGP